MQLRRNKSAISLAAIIISGFIVASFTPFSQAFAQNASNDSTNGSSQGSTNTVKTLRIGYFPNINHAQAVIGFGSEDFQKALGVILRFKQPYLMLGHQQ